MRVSRGGGKGPCSLYGGAGVSACIPTCAVAAVDHGVLVYRPADAVRSCSLSPARSGGPRKCVGDQFALMEAVVVLAVLLKKYSFELVPGREVGVTTGATIHTSNGLYMYVRRRGSSGAAVTGSSSGQEQQAAATAAAAATAVA